MLKFSSFDYYLSNFTDWGEIFVVFYQFSQNSRTFFTFDLFLKLLLINRINQSLAISNDSDRLCQNLS